MLKRLPIRLKLVLLAGVPVIGALILAALAARNAEQQAESAAALGSIEDLARLSAKMSQLVHELSLERTELALRRGLDTPSTPELAARFARTNEAGRQLTAFLKERSVGSLPPRLARDLSAAERQLQDLPQERQVALAKDTELARMLARYKSKNRSLISATAALAQLSNDGEIMRAISALVSVLEIEERASQEHALLSYVFAVSEFPPGTFKDFVTLTTEEADYVNVLEVNASDAVTRRFHAVWRSPELERAAELRRIALDTVDDRFNVDPLEWYAAQGKKLAQLRTLEVSLNDAVAAAALGKVQAANRAVLLSYGLGAGVIVISALLAWLIARGVSRSVANLAQAAAKVRADKDFGVRAQKTSDDELGALTDAFNDMLSGIQRRDQELTHHHQNLERLVGDRTAALQERHVAMRLVLDNVEQGLATIEPDGQLWGERSRAFDAWFGSAREGESFADRIAQHDPKLRTWLKLGWEQVTGGLLPPDAALDQLPKRLEVNGRHYQTSYKAMLDEDELMGALLVVTDVTSETQRLERDAQQRELLSTFEHLTRDRAGTLEFLRECEALVALATRPAVERRSVLIALHTLKGNAGTFGVTSVAQAAHELETLIADSGELPESEQLAELESTWYAFTARLQRLLGQEVEAVVELTHGELEQLLGAIDSRVPHAALAERLRQLKAERVLLRLQRLGEQAKSLAERLGKGSLEVELEADSAIRFPRERWAPFWAAFVHAVRNALDHGIERPDERRAAGKPPAGKLRLAAVVEAEFWTIELRDDGRGVDFQKVREQARLLGLPHTTQAELVDALFSDGFSTADSVSELSGRGIGMGALRSAAEELGGEVTLESTPGAGTTLRVRFPIAAARKPNDPSPEPNGAVRQSETRAPPQ